MIGNCDGPCGRPLVRARNKTVPEGHARVYADGMCETDYRKAPKDLTPAQLQWALTEARRMREEELV